MLGQDGGNPKSFALLIWFLEPSWHPKTVPNGAQDDQKSIKKRFKKQLRSRTVLRRSWTDLGPILARSWGQKNFNSIGFLYYFVEIDVFEKQWSQDASWDDLGSIWAAKRVEKGGLCRPKLGQKREGKTMRKKTSSWKVLGGGGRIRPRSTLARE